MATKQDERAQLMIDAVRKALGTWDGKVASGRVGLTLKSFSLAEKFEDVWGKHGYYLLQRSDNTLRNEVAAWAIEHGLSAEVESYNREARSRYWHSNQANWNQRRERLIKERERIEKELADVEAYIQRYSPQANGNG